MALPEKSLKDKVKEVKQLAPNFSPNDVAVVLEHYDYNVQQSVSALLENGGMDALQSWTQTSKVLPHKSKKKNDKKDANADKQGTHNQTMNSNAIGLNGTHKPNDVGPEAAKKNLTSLHPATSHPKNPHAGLEKSCKELQRQATSLVHLKIVFSERIEKSYKRITEVFKELQQQLAERQAELISQLDKSKEMTSEALCSYEAKAGELRIKTDRAQSMSSEQVALLRSEIKEFVAHKRHYEELAHSSKFNCDISKILLSIQEFGEVPPMKVITVSADHQDHDESAAVKSQEILESEGPSKQRILNQSESLLKYEADAVDQKISEEQKKSPPPPLLSSPRETRAPDRGSGFRRGTRGVRGGRRPYRSTYSRGGGPARNANETRQGNSVGVK